MKKLLLFILPVFIQAQDVAIGNWKDYLSYNSALFTAEAKDKIYCVASGGLFYIDKKDKSINRVSKINGLSDCDVQLVDYSDEFEITIITYANCNIDLLKNDQVVNISDLKRKEFAGKKTINNITINGSTAYLSTSIGLILVDLINEEIKDTYNTSEDVETNEINGCAFLGDSIIVATSNGMYSAYKNNPFLANYSNWKLYSIGSFDNVKSSGDELFVDSSFAITSISYNNGSYVKTFTDSIIVNNTISITDPKLENVKHAMVDDEGAIWVSDSVNGLLKFNDFNYQETFKPDGPKSNSVFSLEFINDRLYSCHGGYVNFGHQWIKDGVSIKNNFDSWRNYNYYDLGNARDIVAAASYGKKTYFASYYNGVPELENEEFSVRHKPINTNYALDTINDWANDKRTKISDLQIDKDGNLWGLNANVKNPLFVKKLNGDWHSFSMNQPLNGLVFGDLLIDNYNQKWGILGRGNGIFVYNDNNTISDLNDDQYTFLNLNIGSGNLPSMYVYCFTNDLDGEVWVGTEKGVAVFYEPSAIFSGYNFDAQQILITDGDYGQYLLSEEKINCITVDGANRKWVGTENSGLFLFSEDGEEELIHFTKNNSPLLSNNIVDVTINHKNGEVFIGTDKGLMSYRSDATEGISKQSKTHIFPNPVKENYTGPIAISKLYANANVKITDVSGNLVFETTANGGQAIWNGKNKNGEKPSTGVYLVFSTDVYGAEKIVGKILFIY